MRKVAGQRKLFCAYSPLTYEISTVKCILLRCLQNIVHRVPFARHKQTNPLPVLVYQHNSLIRRRLGQVDMQLQENKAVNLSLAAPRVNGIIIGPGEVFSFWRLVGPCTRRRGYQEGMTITHGGPASGVGGGMCQFTNLIHWMALHSPLSQAEHHHHDQFDLFPDYGRQIPFGTGTSILYNYMDYRLRNSTDITFQLLVWVDGEYLHGELRADKLPLCSYHIRAVDDHFVEEPEGLFRVGQVVREVFDRRTGNLLEHQVIKENHAKVMYNRAETKKA